MTDPDQDMLERLTPFVDGELSDQAARDVERHIQDNPGYRRLVAAERATKRAVAACTARHPAPPELHQRIRAMLFEATEPQDTQTKPARPLVWQALTQRPAVATAVGALALVAALTTVVVLFSAHRVTPFVRDVYAHHTDVNHFPIQFEGDYESVAAETSDAVHFPVTVPQLDDSLTLVGARKCHLCGHVMAFIKYEGDEGLISFFVVPETHPAIWRLAKHPHDEMTFYTTDYEGVRMAFWREKSATYCLAGSVGEDRLIGLACTACRQVQFTENGTSDAVLPVLLAAHGRDGGP